MSLAGLLSASVFGQESKLLPKKMSPSVAKSSVMEHYKNEAIWTNDFSNPADWSMSNSSTPDANWVIGDAGDWPSTLVDQNFDPLNSTSAGNFAFIDSDGQGQAGTQNADLTLVNPIDLRDYDKVSIVFENFHRRYQESHTIRLSTDGENWTDVAVNTSYEVNTQSENPEVVLVDVSEYVGGDSTVYMQFNYRGAWDWFWAIDDVCIVETPENDLVMRNAWVGDTEGDYEYQSIPLTQAHTQQFGVRFSNVGFANQTDIQVVATVSYNGNTETFETTVASLAKATDTTVWFSGILPAEIGDYDVDFEVIPRGQENSPENNVFAKSFSVTDGLFGQANGWSSTYLFDSEDGGAPFTPITIGQSYNTYNDGDMVYGLYTIFPNDEGDFSPNQFLSIVLYKYLDPSNPDPEAMEVVVTGEYDIEADDLSGDGEEKWIFIPFDVAVPLEEGEIYFGAIEVPGGNDQYNIASKGKNNDAGCLVYGDVDNSGSERWVYYGSINAAIMLVLDENLSVEDNLKLQSKVNIFPNPTSGIARIQLSPGEHLVGELELMDVSGKTIRNSDHVVATSIGSTVEMDYSYFNDGVYFVKITTNRRVLTRKIVVKH